jgi:phospholipase/carboxylesterase
MPVPLSGPILPPANGRAADRLVLLLHGYGADGNDLIGLGGQWAELLPGALFVSPNAPSICAQNGAGYEWFPLGSDRAVSRKAGAAMARPVLIAFLETLWRRTGLGPGETWLIGFSQGAMMALNAGLSLDAPLRGIVAFSGALIPPDDFDTRPANGTPVLLVHGEADGVVEARMSREAARILGEAGYGVELRLFPGLAHGISPAALDAATGFIARRETDG